MKGYMAAAAIIALELAIIVGAIALVATDKSIGIPVEQMPRTINQTEDPPLANPNPAAKG